MISMAISVFKVFLMVVPAIVGVRIFFLGPETAQQWSGYRFSKRDVRRFRWLIRFAGLLLIAFSAYCAWIFL